MNKKFIIQRHKNRDNKDIFVFKNINALYREEVMILYRELKEILEEEICKCYDEYYTEWSNNGFCKRCNLRVEKL